MDLILAVVLLQTIGLFHQQVDQRVSSNVYHGMLVMVSYSSKFCACLFSPSVIDDQEIRSIESRCLLDTCRQPFNLIGYCLEGMDNV